MAYAFAEITFTPNVRAEQERNGAGHYARFLSNERQGGATMGANEAAFISARDGFYQATVSETGWPYVQFRGGPRGFIRVLDETTLAYLDLRGNRQYLSRGNLTGNDRISLILMDYPSATRLKVWGRATTVEASTIPQLPHGDAQVETAVVIKVEAFDWNCPRHIPRRLTAEEMHLEMAALELAKASDSQS